MIRLVGTLSVYGEAIEADFQQTYGLDLSELLARGRFARINRLIGQLPDSSRFVVRIARDATTPSSQRPDISWWPRTDRLLATVVDELAIANWQRSGGKSAKPVLLTEPLPAPAPERVPLDQEKVRAHLKSIGPRGGDSR